MYYGGAHVSVRAHMHGIRCTSIKFTAVDGMYSSRWKGLGLELWERTCTAVDGAVNVSETWRQNLNLLVLIAGCNVCGLGGLHVT